MEHNTTQEMKEIIDAIEQRKAIQWYNDCYDEWTDTTDEIPNFIDFTYRIKPEEPKKKWRPFKDTAELFAHNNSHDILWLKSKATGECRLITRYGSDYVKMPCKWHMDELLETHTFKDGTPCGVEEDA